MKLTNVFTLSLASVLACLTLSTSAWSYRLHDGEIEGVGQGYKGKIVIAIKRDGEKLTSVRVLKHHESKTVGAKILKRLPDIAVKRNGLVDTVSGATYTSKGFNKALKDALDKATH